MSCVGQADSWHTRVGVSRLVPSASTDCRVSCSSLRRLAPAVRRAPWVCPGGLVRGGSPSPARPSRSPDVRPGHPPRTTSHNKLSTWVLDRDEVTSFLKRRPHRSYSLHMTHTAVTQSENEVEMCRKNDQRAAGTALRCGSHADGWLTLALAGRRADRLPVCVLSYEPPCVDSRLDIVPDAVDARAATWPRPPGTK